MKDTKTASNKKDGKAQKQRGNSGNQKSSQKSQIDKKRQSLASSYAAGNSGNNSGTKDAGGAASSPPAPAMDVHPYPRGSVIEVLYIPATAVGKTTASIQAAATSSDPWYWSEDSSLCSTTSNSTGGEDEEEDGHDNKKDVAMKDAKKKSTKSSKEEKTKKKGASPQQQQQHHHHHHHHHHQNAASVRLCDIIDRVPVNEGSAGATIAAATSASSSTGGGGGTTTGSGSGASWRYYVHYRDFNRRMDEWIGQDRIVSPPSVGNAKARALKKEEERQKRKQQRLEEKQRAEQQKKEQKMIGDLDVSVPRSSRRRSAAVQNPNISVGGTTTSTATATGGAGSAAAGTGNSIMQSPTTMTGAVLMAGAGGGDHVVAAGTGGGAVVGSSTTSGSETTKKGRPTRLRRRSTHVADDDAATVVTGSNHHHQEESTNNPKAPAAVKEILTLPTGTASATTTTTVGEHVVATIPAQELDEHEGLDEASLREHEEITKIKNVSFIELGRHQMETWYFSPIPKELLSQRGYIEVLYICEFSFRLFARKSELQRFQQRSLNPQERHPPGNEIYRKDNLSMFEVDGLTERIYCQNLSYIAKLFLDHKTLYFDVDPFLFYVLCEVDDRGYHPVGYYSKEKYSDVGYNLACILTFPAHQRKGYGRFLIAFSYELSKKQEKVGGPERPVSDLGQKAYKPYWAATVIDFLRTTGKEKDAYGNILSSSLSIMDISKRTSIMAEDIVFALNQMGILKIINGVYFIAAEEKLLEELAKKYPVKEPRVDAKRLHWTPFLTDVKRDKFSIHSKKPNVESINTAVQQPMTPAAQQQLGQLQQTK